MKEIKIDDFESSCCGKKKVFIPKNKALNDFKIVVDKRGLSVGLLHERVSSERSLIVLPQTLKSIMSFVEKVNGLKEGGRKK